MDDMPRTTIRSLVHKVQDSANLLQYHRVEWEMALDDESAGMASVGWAKHHAEGMRGQVQFLGNLIKTLEPALDILGADNGKEQDSGNTY